MFSTATFGSGRRAEAPRGKRLALALLAFIAFLGIVVFVIRAEEADDVVEDFTTLGAALGFVLAVHVVGIACDATAWRVLFRGRPRGAAGFFLFFWARWVREATNLLLPVAQIGGEIVGARLLTLCGVPLRLAGPSVVLDKLAEALSQIPFTLLGLVLLVALDGESAMSQAIAMGLASLFLLMLAAAFLLHRVDWDWLKRRAFLRGRRWLWLDKAQSFAAAMRTIYRPGLLIGDMTWHLMAWLVGAGETWLAMRLMGHPVSPAEAIILESLGQAITSLGFMVPAALGVQEGAYIAVGMTLGLPAETALALSLVKRVRQIGLGLPALCSWQVLELRHALAVPANLRAIEAPPPSSDSNSYVRRFIRVLLRPLAGTRLSPNAITMARIVTGLGACAASAVGGAPWTHGAALLWLVSAVLDRGDGEFARLTDRCTRAGHRLDYWGDITINSLIFLAIGLGLRRGGFGEWTVGFGVLAALIVAAASILAEQLEGRIGQKTVPSGHGFDSDDIVFALVPILWLGYLAPLLVGAVIGSSAAALYIWHRLSQAAIIRRAT